MNFKRDMKNVLEYALRTLPPEEAAKTVANFVDVASRLAAENAYQLSQSQHRYTHVTVGTIAVAVGCVGQATERDYMVYGSLGALAATIGVTIAAAIFDYATCKQR